MAFPREAFVADLPYPPEPKPDHPVVTEFTARNMIRNTIDRARKLAGKSLAKRILIYYPDSYTLINISHEEPQIVYGISEDALTNIRSVNQSGTVDDAIDLQQLLLEEAKMAGLDENHFSESAWPLENGAIEQTRTYPASNGLSFVREARLTPEGNPIQASWRVSRSAGF